MARKRRPYTVQRYMAIYTYMSRAERLEVLCLFGAIYEQKTSGSLISVVEAAIAGVVTFVLDRLGAAGVVSAALINILRELSNQDVLGCARAIREGGGGT